MNTRAISFSHAPFPLGMLTRMRAILTGTDRRQQLAAQDCVRVGDAKKRERGSETAVLGPKSGAAKLIPDKDFCLDDFLDKQDTDVVSGSEG